MPIYKPSKLAANIAKQGDHMKYLIATLLFLNLTITQAALPPQYQNSRDLDVMVNFVKEHRIVAAQLKRIDFETHQVHYADNCVANFHRPTRFRLPGWAGPADPLKFKNSTCAIK